MTSIKDDYRIKPRDNSKKALNRLNSWKNEIGRNGPWDEEAPEETVEYLRKYILINWPDSEQAKSLG